MSMTGKILIIAFLIAIVWNLGAGFYYMMTDKGRSNRTVRALSWRIGLSVLLIVLIIIGMLTFSRMACKAGSGEWGIGNRKAGTVRIAAFSIPHSLFSIPGFTAHTQTRTARARPRRRSASTRPRLQSRNGCRR